jgi:hypothetical protein
MARRRRNNEADKAEAIVKIVFGSVVLLALATGGIAGFAQRLSAIMSFVIVLVLMAAVIGAIVLVVKIVRRRQQRTLQTSSGPILINVTPAAATFDSARPSTSMPEAFSPVRLNTHDIKERLAGIDWFQFEKFCAAVLRAEGWDVERKGGAQPDGGVDLIASKGDARMLVQCKHWRTWTIQEKTIRELLGSMTHFAVSKGALYTLKGWTEPSRRFAEEHGILLANADDLAVRAMACISVQELEGLLTSDVHHCPKCESPMIWRTGDFEPFWGCSQFPRCRSILRRSGAR